jgi:hypothetical protein
MFYSESTGVVRPFTKTVTISGTFEFLTLYDLLINLTHSGKGSRIFALVDNDEAEVIVHGGQVIATAYQHTIGERALLKLFEDTRERYDVEFIVESLPELFDPAHFRTIHLPLEQLLMAVIMQIEAKA